MRRRRGEEEEEEEEEEGGGGGHHLCLPEKGPTRIRPPKAEAEMIAKKRPAFPSGYKLTRPTFINQLVLRL